LGKKEVGMDYTFDSSFGRPCVKFKIQQNQLVWATGGCWWYEMGKANLLVGSGPSFYKNNTKALFSGLFMTIKE